MNVFKTCALSEVTVLITKGTTPTTLGHPFTDTGINFIKAESVTLDGQIDESVFAHIDEATHAKLKRSQIMQGDILFSIAGMKLGKSALVKSQHVPANTNQAVAIIRADRSKALPEFLHYHFLNPDHYRHVNAVTAQSAQPNINLAQVGNLKISLPPLQVQSRIAGILSAYDQQIENTQRRIKLLESMARALYREWFLHLRPPSHESASRAPLPQEENRNEWEVKELGDICELRKDTYRDQDHAELPLIDMARMPSRSLAPSDTGSPSELTTSRILFQKGDTLFGSIRCYLHKVITANFSGVTNTSVLVLRPKAPSFRSLLAIIASDIETIRWAETQSTGTKMPVINWGVFQTMPIRIPSSQLAQKFENMAGPMLDELGILGTQIQSLRRTRDLLLPRLLSGQINVEAMTA